MTRINCVHPSMLSDQHLLAAWKEYIRIITAVEKLIEKGKAVDDIDIPEKYTFGAGHCKFFYNKLSYIRDLIHDVYNEMYHQRRMKVNHDIISSVEERFEKILSIKNGGKWCASWKPTPEDIYLNMARLVERNFKTNMRVEGRKVVEDETT